MGTSAVRPLVFRVQILLSCSHGAQCLCVSRGTSERSQKLNGVNFCWAQSEWVRQAVEADPDRPVVNESELRRIPATPGKRSNGQVFKLTGGDKSVQI